MSEGPGLLTTKTKFITKIYFFAVFLSFTTHTGPLM